MAVTKKWVVAPDVKLYIDGKHLKPGDPVRNPAQHFIDMGSVVEAPAKTD
jgi:hypothetical protein